ncbi:hypothetical protein FPM66_11265 [Salmonella enterica]|nr:hypothetical protein [Salmonella enterica]
MKESFFNPDDIQETIIGLKKQHGHSMRSSTNGIPDFVSRRSQEKNVIRQNQRTLYLIFRSKHRLQQPILFSARQTLMSFSPVSRKHIK